MSGIHWGCCALLRSHWEHPFPLPGEGMHLDPPPLTISFYHHVEFPHLKGPINIFYLATCQPSNHSCKSKPSQQCKGSSRDDPFFFKGCSFSSPMSLIPLTNYPASGLGTPLLPHRHREGFPALATLSVFWRKDEKRAPDQARQQKSRGTTPFI